MMASARDSRGPMSHLAVTGGITVPAWRPLPVLPSVRKSSTQSGGRSRCKPRRGYAVISGWERESYPYSNP
jgi:hypothetical protein